MIASPEKFVPKEYLGTKKIEKAENKEVFKELPNLKKSYDRQVDYLQRNHLIEVDGETGRSYLKYEKEKPVPTLEQIVEKIGKRLKEDPKFRKKIKEGFSEVRLFIADTGIVKQRAFLAEKIASRARNHRALLYKNEHDLYRPANFGPNEGNLIEIPAQLERGDFGAMQKGGARPYEGESAPLRNNYSPEKFTNQDKFEGYGAVMKKASKTDFPGWRIELVKPGKPTKKSFIEKLIPKKIKFLSASEAVKQIKEKGERPMTLQEYISDYTFEIEQTGLARQEYAVILGSSLKAPNPNAPDFVASIDPFFREKEWDKVLVELHSSKSLEIDPREVPTVVNV